MELINLFSKNASTDKFCAVEEKNYICSVTKSHTT